MTFLLEVNQLSARGELKFAMLRKTAKVPFYFTDFKGLEFFEDVYLHVNEDEPMEDAPKSLLIVNFGCHRDLTLAQPVFIYVLGLK